MIPFVCTVAAFAALVRTLAGEPFDASALWAIFAVGIAGAVVVFFRLEERLQENLRGRLHRVRGHPPAPRRPPEEAAHELLQPPGHDRRCRPHHGGRDGAGVHALLDAPAAHRRNRVDCGHLRDARLLRLEARLLRYGHASAFGGVIALSRRHQSRLFERQNRVRLDALARVQDYLEGIKDIRACRAVGKDSAAMEQAMLELKRVTMRVELAVDVSVSLASAILRSGSRFDRLRRGGASRLRRRRLHGSAHVLAHRLPRLRPILALVSQLPNLLNLSTKTARIKAVMDEPEARGSASADVPGHDLSFQGVRFGYGDEEVLHGVSFDAQEGRVTALVGPSGSGKSTCAQLAAKFWEPDSGRILCSGKDIAGFSEESWLAHVSIVFQDVILFDDTVANNIRIGREGASDEEVAEAARAAHCLEFIERLPQGFDTVLGENGASLSGGERQRLSIARAL